MNAAAKMKSLEPLVVQLTADTTKFVKAMRRAATATRAFGIAWTGDYIVTGVRPYGGPWSRQSLKAD